MPVTEDEHSSGSVGRPEPWRKIDRKKERHNERKRKGASERGEKTERETGGSCRKNETTERKSQRLRSVSIESSGVVNNNYRPTLAAAILLDRHHFPFPLPAQYGFNGIYRARLRDQRRVCRRQSSVGETKTKTRR